MAEPKSEKLLLEKTWEKIQQKTFTKWINSKLAKRALSITDLQTDFANGVMLIKFLETISNETLPKHTAKPTLRIQFVQNVSTGLDFIKKKGVKLINISAEDIVDQNLKLVLGLVWTIIQKFAIEDISEEELSAKEALLLWCKKKTAGYRDVNVKDFTYSWQDGLALCALIHRHRPDLLDFDSLDKNNKAENLQLAFNVAENSLGIAQLLDVEDIVDIKPDERSVITYLSQFYHVFATSQKAEVAGRRIGKLVDLTSANDALKNDYSNRAHDLVDWINQTRPALEERDFPNNLEGVRQKLNDFHSYKTDTKPPKAVEKNELESLFNNIAIKLRNNNRPAFVPAEGLSPTDIDENWTHLGKAEADREKALLAELERQEKLAGLLRRYLLKADLLEKWNSSKQQYLSVDEKVDSLKEAQSKLKDLDAFDEEYKESKQRINSFESLAKEILDLNPHNADEVRSRSEEITSTWKGLEGPQHEKRKDLDDKLHKEQKKEELRLEFAKQAKEYNLWIKETTNAVKDFNFGLTLEDVQAYEADLSATEHQATSTSETKKSSLDQLWDELTSLGVTENRYTPITNKDIEATHNNLKDNLKARRAAYQAELERQQLLEEKRKEFAHKAQAFVDSLNDRRSALDALTGEPDELIASIKSTYQEGHPEKEGLASLSSLQEELAALGIRENKHTTYNLPILTSLSNKLANHVRNYIAVLQDEKELKHEYVTKATALTHWANSTLPGHRERDFDNTLAGAREKSNEWTKYQTTTKATQDIDRINLAVLAKKISDLLAKHNRPAFLPPQGLDTESIDHLWEQLNAEEKAREEAINAELARQEKLAALFKRFTSEAADLEAWAHEKEAYLNQKEDIHNLDEARLRKKFLEVFSTEFASKSPPLNSLKSLRDEIVSLNYIDTESVNNRLSAIESTFAHYHELESKKHAEIDASHEVEQKKENLRLKFAELALEFAKFVRESVENIDDYNFGFTLEDVTAYRDVLNQNNEQITSAAHAKKEAVDHVLGELQNSGVTDNRHTTHSAETVKELDAQLHSALEKRNQAYEQELSRQVHNDNKRREFAEKAAKFVNWVEEKKKELLALEGSPDERIAGVLAIHGEGAPGQAHIDDLKASDEELKSLGVFDNKHTPHTLPILSTRNNQFDTSVKNFLSDLNDEKELNSRAAAQQAEYEYRLKIENLRLEFGKHAHSVNFFLETASETFTDPIISESVEHAHSLRQNIQNLQKQQCDADIKELNSLSAALSAEGVDVPVVDFNARWDNYLKEAEDRIAALDKEVARQEANEALRKSFADKANSFHSWLEKQTAIVNAPGEGELEAQVAALQAHRPEIHNGKDQLVAIEGLSEQLIAVGVTRNQHTHHTFASLSAEYTHLIKVVNDKEALLQKEILQKKGKALSAEQLNEFNEVFQHFAKEKGHLTKLDFKASLQSLGEAPTDADIDRLVAELSTDGKIGFEAFASHMTTRAADTDSHEQILEAFKIVAADKDFITEADLRSVLPKEKADYLVKHLPRYEGNVPGAFDYKAWAAGAFAK